MKKSVFEYQNYKEYLIEFIRAQPKGGRGQRSQLAAAIGCQISFLSQILRGSIDLSLEQAIKANLYLGHSKDEGHYFLLLVQLSRAGDRNTQRYFREQIEEQTAKRLVIKNRLGLATGLTPEDQVTYYSAWYFAAAHILVTIPQFRTRDTIAKKLGIPLKKTNEVLGFLERTGLLEKQGTNYKTGKSQIHLGHDSNLISRHHSIWRVQAMNSLDRERESDIHYSAVFSLSRSDLTKVKQMVVKQIEEVVSVVKKSEEEELAVFTLDFFEM